MRTDVLGVGFDDLTREEAAAKGIELVLSGNGAYAVTPNPEIVYACRKDEKLRSVINCADLVLADGVGIAYGARILKRPLKATVPGVDFAADLMALMEKEGQKLFLFGGRPGVAEKAAQNLGERFPALDICGTMNGYGDSGRAVEEINKSGARAVFVCLGSPKQELWMDEFRGSLNVGLLAGLGGSLDVFSGEAKRAPEKWRRLKLEWLYRLIKEPRRIKRVVKLPLFMFAVIGRRIKGDGKSAG